MSIPTSEGTSTSPSAATDRSPSPDRRPSRPPIAPIPFGRVVVVELRKSFDTRAGFWLLLSIGITALLAVVAAIVWAPDEAMTFETFASSIGIPMNIVLPIVAILSITSEWSQRTGLSTFTLVPVRGRSIAAKAVGALVVGLVSILLALGLGALGNIVGASIRGLDVVWDSDLTRMSTTVLAQLLSMAIGFTLGILLRSSAAAIVGYFVFGFVLPTLTSLLAMTQEWFEDVRGWVDLGFTQTKLYDTALSAEEWSQLAVVSLVWLALPLAVGLWRLRRAEIA